MTFASIGFLVWFLPVVLAAQWLLPWRNATLLLASLGFYAWERGSGGISTTTPAIRDYVYIPLGGSRAGPWRTGCNLLMVFALCGIWHGAAYAVLLLILIASLATLASGTHNLFIYWRF